MLPSLDAHQQQFGRVPRLVAADAGFFSLRNEADAHEPGVKRVAIPEPRTKSAERKALQKSAGSATPRSGAPAARAASVSLKRRHGLNRCRYKGTAGMKRWVGLGVIADNLINIAQVLDGPPAFCAGK